MRRYLALLLLLAMLLGLFGCTANVDPGPVQADTDAQTEPAPETEAQTGELSLQEDYFAQAAATEDNARVFYEIFVGSFSDSNGDGVGDLKGVLNRLDYLNDGDPTSGKSLGIEGIWLTPIFTSPSYHKYDVADYYEIDPKFGTMEDLQALIDACHARGVKLILDMVINHTSTQCSWYKSFVQAHKDQDTESEFYNFYSWSQEDSIPAGRVFNKIGGTLDYYECNFWDQMPELNFDNPQVRQTVLDVAKFYLDMGIDGFRFDAAKYIYYGEHERSVEFWNWYMDELRAYKPDIYTVAEVWDSDGVTDLYFDALNCFDFTVSQAEGLIAQTANKGDVNSYCAYVQSYLEAIAGKNPDAMYLPFIANHDTDRAAGYLPDASGQMQMAANLYLLGPGSPFLYYGEELGMRGSRGGANTDSNRRLAMVWGDGDTVKDPEGTTYQASNQISAGAMQQMEDPNSLYTYYKKVIAIRKANPEIARGVYTALSFPEDKASGFVASLDGSFVCVIHNTTQREITIDLSKGTDLSFTQITAMIGLGEATLNGTMLTLGAQTSVVLR